MNRPVSVSPHVRILLAWLLRPVRFRGLSSPSSTSSIEMSCPAMGATLPSGSSSSSQITPSIRIRHPPTRHLVASLSVTNNTQDGSGVNRPGRPRAGHGSNPALAFRPFLPSSPPWSYATSDRPVLDAQAGDAVEVSPVAGDDHRPMFQGDGGDAQIHETNIEPEGLEL